jgi:hypothetical protein
VQQAALVLVAALLTSACASTRVSSLGTLLGDRSLITVVVTEDRDVVARECQDVRAEGAVLGCQMSWPVHMSSGLPVRATKIVRYTDALPSDLAFEIEVHELCHAVAALQLIADPCHEGNGGVAQSALPRAIRFP